MGIRERVTGLTLILDTNFIMYIADGSIPLSQLFETIPYNMRLAIVKSTLKELEFLVDNAPRLKDRRKARRALEILKKLNVEVIESETGNVDDDIVIASLRLKAAGSKVVVATGDKELRRRLRERGIPTLYPRGPEMMPRIDWEPL